MFKSRMTIAGLMAVIALLGVEFGAMRTGSPFWFSAIYTLTVVLLLIATLQAKLRRPSARAFWFGFALFGWVYLLLVLGPWSSLLARNMGGGVQTSPSLLTTYLFWSRLHAVRGSASTYGAVDEFTECTTGMAHLMVTLVVGLVGGWAAVLVRGRRNRPQSAKSAAASAGTRALMLLALGGGALIAFFGARAFRAEPAPAYFPPFVFHDEAAHDQFVVDWYSKHLRAMREPSLWEAGQAKNAAGFLTYRLLWLPSFDHPACVRITQSGDSATIRVVVLDGMGGYEPGQVAIDKSIRLSTDDFADIAHRLIQLNFWKLPTKLEDDLGSDGDQLILEGASAGQYHIVDRWSPDEAYLEACRAMIDLSGIKAWKAVEDYHTVQ